MLFRQTKVSRKEAAILSTHSLSFNPAYSLGPLGPKGLWKERAAELDHQGQSAQAALHHARAASKFQEASALVEGADREELQGHAQDLTARAVYLESLGAMRPGRHGAPGGGRGAFRQGRPACRWRTTWGRWS